MLQHELGYFRVLAGQVLELGCQREPCVLPNMQIIFIKGIQLWNHVSAELRILFVGSPDMQVVKRHCVFPVSQVEHVEKLGPHGRNELLRVLVMEKPLAQKICDLLALLRY